MKQIGIAVVIERGYVLTGVRRPGQPLAGHAEFPGGKCQPDESPARAAVRECREESGLPVEVLEPLLTQPWRYPHGEVELHFILCRPAVPVDVSGELRGFRWRPLEEISQLNFPAANAAVIELLLRRSPEPKSRKRQRAEEKESDAFAPRATGPDHV